MTQDEYNLIADQCSKKGLNEFLSYITIDSRPPQRLSQCVQPYQIDLFKILIPLFNHVAGIQEVTNRRAFILGTKGVSKTSTIALCCAWLLQYSRQKINIVCCAATKDQANLLRNRLIAESSHNTFLNLKLKNYKIEGKMGVLEILASDAANNSGILPDMIIMDELSNWSDRRLFDFQLASANKRRAALIIMSNCGTTDHFSYDIWNNAKDHWKTLELKIIPDFCDKEQIEQDRKLLLPQVYRMLYSGDWINLADDCSWLDITPCIDINLHFNTSAKDCPRIAAVDLGLVNDKTVGVIMHMKNDIVYLDQIRCWQGNPTAPVSIAAVEDWLLDCCKKYHIAKLCADPWQMQQTCEKFARYIPEIERFNFNTNSHFKLAENFRTLALSGRFKTPYHKELIEEFKSVYVELKPNNTYRVQHLPNKHDDIVVACWVKNTLIKTIKGEIPIQNIKIGDLVLTRQGYKHVKFCGSTGYRKVISNGILTGTPEHPIFTHDGWKDFHFCNNDTLLYTWNPASLNTTVSNTEDTQTQNKEIIEFIIKRIRNGKVKLDICTEIFGKKQMDQFLKVIKYITKTKTHLITYLKIWNVFLQNLIAISTTKNENKEWKITKAQNCIKRIYKIYGRTETNLMRARKVKSIVKKTQNIWQKHGWNVNLLAFTVGNYFYEKQIEMILPNGVQNHVVIKQQEPEENFIGIANLVGKNLLRKNIALDSVQTHVIKTGVGHRELEKQEVFNLEVEDCPEYFANGILVHNCMLGAFSAVTYFGGKVHQILTPDVPKKEKLDPINWNSYGDTNWTSAPYLGKN